MSARAMIERPMPEGAAARLDAARSTLASLRDEERRLERLGLETPLARCHDQVRYWRFVAGLLSLPERDAAADAFPRGPRWLDAWR